MGLRTRLPDVGQQRNLRPRVDALQSPPVAHQVGYPGHRHRTERQHQTPADAEHASVSLPGDFRHCRTRAQLRNNLKNTTLIESTRQLTHFETNRLL